MARKRTKREAEDVATLQEAVTSTGFELASTTLRKPDLIATAFEDFNNNVIQAGGFPRGRWVQLWGPEASGKTSLALHILAMAQRQYPNENVAYLDTEYKLDRDWAESQGVDLSRMYIKSTGIAEEAMQWTNEVVRNGNISVLVVDSVGNIAPSMAFGDNQWVLGKDGERVNKPRPGHTAALETEWVHTLSKYAKDHNVLVLVINQIRMKIGVLYGNPEDTPGAKALRYILTMNLQTRKVGDILDESKEVIGFEMYVKVGKNSMGTVASTTDANHLTFYTQDTISRARASALLIKLASAGKLLRAGAWWRLVRQTGDSDNPEMLMRWGSRSALLNALADDALVTKLQEYLDHDRWEADDERD